MGADVVQKMRSFFICTIIFPFHSKDLMPWCRWCSEKNYYQTDFSGLLLAGIRVHSRSFLVPEYAKKSLSLVFGLFFRLIVKAEWMRFLDGFCAGCRLGKVSRGLQNNRKLAELTEWIGGFSYQNHPRLLKSYLKSIDCLHIRYLVTQCWRTTPLKRIGGLSGRLHSTTLYKLGSLLKGFLVVMVGGHQEFKGLTLRKVGGAGGGC